MAAKTSESLLAMLNARGDARVARPICLTVKALHTYNNDNKEINNRAAIF